MEMEHIVAVYKYTILCEIYKKSLISFMGSAQDVNHVKWFENSNVRIIAKSLSGQWVKTATDNVNFIAVRAI